MEVLNFDVVQFVNLLLLLLLLSRYYLRNHKGVLTQDFANNRSQLRKVNTVLQVNLTAVFLTIFWTISTMMSLYNSYCTAVVLFGLLEKAGKFFSIEVKQVLMLSILFLNLLSVFKCVAHFWGLWLALTGRWENPLTPSESSAPAPRKTQDECPCPSGFFSSRSPQVPLLFLLVLTGLGVATASLCYQTLGALTPSCPFNSSPFFWHQLDVP